ncbi:MAG TPA: HdeA/HdeB family chaperone [Stellaceae bacterium]|nr:HdeA/HdeB family chaperone [Stellaceae bacterium]
MILAMTLLCGNAQAADKNTRFQVLGAGVMTCQAYLDANAEDRKLAEMWWTGYVTATNGLTDDTWSVVGRDPNARVNDAIEKQCKDHPKAMFVIALHEALQALYKDNRIETAPTN